MAAFSKLRELSLPYNCYEVGHTWTPECYTAALSVGFCCLFEGMKLYAPLYLVSQILQRKFSLKAFWKTIHSTCTSSCFLCVNGFAFIFIFCLLRKAMGKFYYLHCSYLPAFLASFLAILVEQESRRKPLAMYVTNVASETLFRMATARGLLKPLPNGTVILFSTSMAMFLYIIRKHGFSNDFVSAGFKFLFGKDEANIKPNEIQRVSCKKNPQSETTIHLSEKKLPLFKKLLESKHFSCPHQSGCVHYAFKGLLKPFSIGYLAFSLIRCLSAAKKIISNPWSLLQILSEKKTLNLGIFLGGFGGTFKIVSCCLRWALNRDKAEFALPAALLGAMFMKFFPSPTLSLYLLWKLIEMTYEIGIDQNILPKLPGSMLILYAASTAVLFYAAVLEPHNLRPAYLKFLTKLTHNKIGEINRHVLDIFGTHASRLYSEFWPELDLRYTSRVFQESVLLWLIH